MLIAIPLLKKRVAPRCTFADSLLIVSLRYGRVADQSTIPLEGCTSIDLVQILIEKGIKTLICGGISQSTRESLSLCNVVIIENVTGTYYEILEALLSKKIKSGFGFDTVEEPALNASQVKRESNVSLEETNVKEELEKIDCLNCKDRVCLRGMNCLAESNLSSITATGVIREMLESAFDVAFEDERKLCRLAELVYYCMGMNYKRIGVAFCKDLLQPSKILVEVLRRFFTVFPVCCKIGGLAIEEDHIGSSFEVNENTTNHIACNPLMQAEILNRIETDINVIVGLCVGTDCIFTSASHAPVTTIFVKDKSLANNPIGAVYSDYYLNEI